VITFHIVSQPIVLMLALGDYLLYHTPFNIMVWSRGVYIALYFTSFDVLSWIKDYFNFYGEKLFE
jgi:hypothetical protein